MSAHNLKGDMIGRTFDRLTVIERYPENTKDRKAQWVCQCECGNIVVVSGKKIRNGNTRSCGCLQREAVIKRNFKHGDRTRNNKKRLYSIHRDMIRRCYDLRRPEYQKYGARGIYVCDEWNTENIVDGYLAFKKWSYENGYNDNLSIDRIDNDGPYAPWNCRWTTSLVQSNNRGDFNQHICVDTTVYTFREAERTFGLSRGAISRLYKSGWNTDQIVNKLKHPDAGYTLNHEDGFIHDKNGFIHLTPKTDQSGVRNKYHGNDI